jgi:hypothetical protein
MRIKTMTPAELSLWISTPEHRDAICSLLESGDLKLVECATGATVLRAHSRDILRLEVGDAPILPPSHD